MSVSVSVSASYCIPQCVRLIALVANDVTRYHDYASGSHRGASRTNYPQKWHLAILDVEQPGYFLPTMHSAPRQPSRRVKQTTALHCQRLRIAFISPLFTLSYAKLFFIVCCTNNSVNGDDLAFFRIPNEASEHERRGI